jgi:hypothetical protein
MQTACVVAQAGQRVKYQACHYGGVRVRAKLWSSWKDAPVVAQPDRHEVSSGRSLCAPGSASASSVEAALLQRLLDELANPLQVLLAGTDLLAFESSFEDAESIAQRMHRAITMIEACLRADR